MAKFLAGYASEIADEDCRKRYEEKISNIRMDPYDADKTSFSDNVDLWPAITSIHVGMYLVFSPSPYTGDDLLNYKSMDCYKNFLSGWVREILVKAVDEKKRVVIAKVGCCFLKIVASYIKLIIVKFNCILG